MDANEFCQILAVELNVKKVSFILPVECDGWMLSLEWTLESGLDVCLDGEPQQKPELAVKLFNEFKVALRVE
jgi:hypothetical protein